MPVMGGMRDDHGHRQLPGYSFTPILMLTTESQPEKKDAGRKAGRAGWIVKAVPGRATDCGGAEAGPVADPAEDGRQSRCGRQVRSKRGARL